MDELRQFPHETQIPFPSQARFSHPSLLPRDFARMRPELLYVCRLSEGLRAAAERPELYFICLRDRIKDTAEGEQLLRRMVIINENMDFETLFTSIQDAFFRINDWQQKMQEALIRNKPLQEIIDLSEEIIGNTINISDSAFTLLACTWGIPTDEEVTLSLRAQGYQTVVCNGVIDFLILLGRLHSRPAARNSVRTEIHDAVNAASLYLEQHLTDNLTLEELAGHANMSRAHFCRCFKLVFGSSVWTWLTQRRLELAKQMLATTDLSLKEIAAECGFCSSSYFSRQFKRYLKTTPQNYRMEHSLQYIRAFRFSSAPRKSGRS